MRTNSDRMNKRMTAFVITAGLLTLGLFLGPEAIYPIFAGTLGTIFSTFALSQGYTDGKEVRTEVKDGT